MAPAPTHSRQAPAPATPRRPWRSTLVRLALAAAATTLSGCYVYPYPYHHGYGYGGYGYGYGGPAYYQRPVVVAPGYYRPY